VGASAPHFVVSSDGEVLDEQVVVLFIKEEE